MSLEFINIATQFFLLEGLLLVSGLLLPLGWDGVTGKRHKVEERVVQWLFSE